MCFFLVSIDSQQIYCGRASEFILVIQWIVEYNAALASICFMILLGFVDDVLDMAYAGHTTIVIPKPLIPYVGLEVLDLGWIYKLYMDSGDRICSSTDPEYSQAHAFSIYLVQPLLATSLALLSYNWYPSSVFVGDTYTYFAGMTMAVVGILGYFWFAFWLHSLSMAPAAEV
ncbi:hypothetical protein F0562_015562 [Nyssa sinensis]|uniref:UDP-N-acetylglucosamine--dolichyl-phosphate N-acetylglucosaminephosphotransferase n=1 Tax=Nyssa sinensis TaxID=561372 RepID=A0A5J4ZKL2_9ASTE|nr:hypothetical protein F0562_015562 [Nyssa sinensis]